MSGHIADRLEAWAKDTESSWFDVETPSRDQPGREWYEADMHEVRLMREAADAIRRLERALADASDQVERARRRISMTFVPPPIRENL